MRRAFHIAILLLLLFQQGKSQTFLNGSFEINSAPGCSYNLSNATFTGYMASTVGFGGGGELDIMNNACTYATPQDGNWCAGLAMPSAGDAFTMQLSAPLVAGNTYSICYYDCGRDISGCCPPGGPIQIGVSTTSNTQGTVVYTSPVPTTNSWTQRSFSFVAPNNGQYISVQITAWRWTHVDNFTIGTATCTVVLAPEIEDFTVSQTGPGVNQLSWKTISEEGLKKMVIEHASDGVAFDSIGEMVSNGISGSEFEYPDRHFEEGENFYRIRMIHQDGSSTYSRIVSIRNSGAGTRLLVTPNPGNGIFSINHAIDPASAEAALLEVYDVAGRLVHSEQRLPAAFAGQDIDLSSLEPGIYMLILRHPSGNSLGKLIVE